MDSARAVALARHVLISAAGILLPIRHACNCNCVPYIVSVAPVTPEPGVDLLDS